jgi:hypothetical protein
MTTVGPWMYVPFILMGLALLMWLPTRLRYRITKSHLAVTLFGLPIRRVRLTNIERVTKRHARWAEHWWNTWRPFRRRLMICRRRGLCKNMVITPKYRYEFKAELERAVLRASPPKQELAGTVSLTDPDISPSN